MRFGARPLDLLVASKREDIVPNDVSLAIVLMKSAVGGAINDIACGQNSAAAFVEIDSPTAVTQPCNVMPQIVKNPGSRLLAQCINSAHVAQNRPVAV